MTILTNIAIPITMSKMIDLWSNELNRIEKNTAANVKTSKKATLFTIGWSI